MSGCNLQQGQCTLAARVQTFEGGLNYYFTELPEQIKVSNVVVLATQSTIKDRSCTM